MHIVVGLGNPGRKYDNTRHNTGFRVVDHFADTYDLAFMPGKGDYFQAKGFIRQYSVLVVKPTTYMNLSGLAVKKVLNYYQESPENLLVICDDFNLPLGKIRLRTGGSDGGQKGLASIIFQLQTDQFSRLRIGIDDGGTRGDNAAFVLGKFPKACTSRLENAIGTASDAVLSWIENGPLDAMNKFNGMDIS